MSQIICPISESPAYRAFVMFYLEGKTEHARLNEHGEIVAPCIRDAFAGWKAAYDLYVGVK